MKWLAVILLLLLCSCEQDDIPVPTGVIPESMQPYVDQFVWEAAQRGIAIDVSRLTIEFDNDIEGGNTPGSVVGICTRAGNHQQLIRLDTLNSLWLLSGNLGKEEILFHELGHCMLDRPHKDGTLVSGDFVSIMRSIGLLQYGDLNNFTSLFTGPLGVKAHRRDYYIDELFDQNVPVPCWSDSTIASPYPVRIYKDDFIVNNQAGNLWVDPDNNLWVFGRGNNYINRNGEFESLLPNITVTSLTHDTDGTVWFAALQESTPIIATYAGDTYQIKYTMDDFPESFDRLDQMVIDDLDRIWISESNGNLFVDSGNGFEKVITPDESRIFRMKKAPNNGVYLLRGGQFYMFQDPENFTRLDQSNSDLPSDFFWNFEIDNQGAVWLLPNASASQLIRLSQDLDVTTYNFFQVNLAQLRINAMTVDASGSLWVATANGLKRWEGNEFSDFCKYNTGIPVLNVNNLVVSKNGDVWSIGRDPSTLVRQMVKSQPGI